MRPERRHTLCASLRSRNALQHVTRAAPYWNWQVTSCRPEWGAPRSGTCLYTYRKNPSLWTDCLGNQKTDCNCLQTCDFWTSGPVAGPDTRAPGHNPIHGHTGTRAHGHNPDPRAHGHTGTRAQPRSTGTRAHGHTGRAHQRTNLVFHWGSQTPITSQKKQKWKWIQNEGREKSRFPNKLSKWKKNGKKTKKN